eukprot:CAMPEP_0173319298 /NCGR_PEP_ID=MMETSP1143-20121109/28146_1 /TAXON_ID=483371 /ORGANISM="non described non described, Strain CCMP2298" /LENGTH=190 /DNA_ID=CAMNT_0014262661 /DNA_START=1 /DNA_END=570 /DNA_ORIENTATION=-
MGLYSVLQLLKVNIFRLKALPVAVMSVAQCAALRDLLLRLIYPSPLVEDAALEDALLSLFLCAVRLLYPDVADLHRLMGQYIGKYSAGSITRTEMFLLEFVLKQLSEKEALAQIIDGDQGGASMAFFRSLSEICKREALREGTLGTAVVATMTSYCKLLLARAARPFLAPGASDRSKSDGLDSAQSAELV